MARSATSASGSASRAICASQAAELAASQERAHLARELHDSVTQALFSMGLTLRTLELLLEHRSRTPRAGSSSSCASSRRTRWPRCARSSSSCARRRSSPTAWCRRCAPMPPPSSAEPAWSSWSMPSPSIGSPLSAEEALYRIAPGGAPQRRQARERVERHDQASGATASSAAPLGDRRRLGLRPRHASRAGTSG